MAGSRSAAVVRGSASATVVAEIVGGDRFRMETGRSGKRHVFTRVDGSTEAADLAGAVVMLRAGDRRVWIGPGEWLRAERMPGGAEIHVHWLAETPTERARVLADLEIDDAPTAAAPDGPTTTSAEPALAA